MDYVTVRELREKSGEIWQRIEAGEEFVVTRNGKPFALLVHTEPAAVETALRAHRAARFAIVLGRLQEQARVSGISKLSDDDIQAEVDASRSRGAGARKARKPIRTAGASNARRR